MNDNSIQKKKDEIKNLLKEAETNSGFGFYLNWFGGKIQKVIRSQKRPSELASAIIFYLLIVIISLLLVFLFDKDDIKIIYSKLGSLILLNFFLVITVVLVFKAHFFATFLALRAFFVDSIVSFDDLVDFQKWIDTLLNYKKQFVFSIIFGIFCGVYPPYYIGNLLGFSSIGYAFYLGALSYLGANALYTTYLFISFPLNIKNYKYKIYSANPSQATFCKQLARLLNSTVFLVAILGLVMIFMITLYQFGTNIVVHAMLIIIIWLPITFMFILNQTSLSRIISRAKLQKLAEIEGEINNLEKSKKIADKENLEAINRLMDYHERVQKTRNSSLDFRAILSFLNSLLIPALGFIIDTLIKFLSRGP